MSDVIQTPTPETDTAPDELTLLKKRADLMEMQYHPNIGVDALKKKIEDKLAGTETKPDETAGKTLPPASGETGSGETEEPVVLTAAQERLALRNKIRSEALKLVRVRISNMNPNKNDLEGEIFTVANKYIGEVKKFIPYGESTDGGYHIPMCIYNQLKSKKFLQLRTVKSQTLGKPDTVKQRWVPEFNLEVLEPLTEQELADLARVQAARADGDE